MDQQHDGTKEEAMWNKTSPNILIISESGKPIFARYGSETEIARICGLLQALRGSILYNRSIGGDNESGLGDLQSIETDSMRLVFLQVGTSMTLVAIDNVATTTDSFLRQQLEQVYSQLVFCVTAHVQQAFQHNTNLDLQSVMTGMRGASSGDDDGDSLIQSALNRADTAMGGDPTSLLFCANPSLCPLSSSTRERVSWALETTGNDTENTLFAIAFAVAQGGGGAKLVSLVQPEYGPHLMRSTDLNLLLPFLEQQSGLLTTELWLSVCLPRFNSTGFLYCHTHSLDDGLILTLVSHIGTDEQRQRFHTASRVVRRRLGFQQPHPRVDGVVKDHKQQQDDDNEEDDWVDASGYGDKMMASSAPTQSLLLQDEVRNALDTVESDKFYNGILDVASGAIHFVYRFNAQVQTKPKPQRRRAKNFRSKTIGHLTQCIMSPMRFDHHRRKRIWHTYQKLSLRLRLGSAGSESVQDALSMLQNPNVENQQTTTSGLCHPSTLLMESRPHFTGLTFCHDDDDDDDDSGDRLTYFGMNGPEFELYFVCRGRPSVKEAALSGARLARRIQLEQDRLFLTKPPTWRED